jgi:hypothetical protein
MVHYSKTLRTEIKEKIHKYKVIYKGNSIRITADFSTENLKTRTA